MSSQTLLPSAPLTSAPPISTPLTSAPPISTPLTSEPLHAVHHPPTRSVNGIPNAILNAILNAIRNKLDAIEIGDRRMAHWLCKLIPAQCPFERDICWFGRTLFHIPPMCKLNPFYDQLVGLRFRALCFLADRCGEDISAYC